MIWWIIVIVVWLIGIPVSYKLYLSKQDDSMFDKIWLSVVWPTLIPLYIIHVIHNS